VALADVAEAVPEIAPVKVLKFKPDGSDGEILQLVAA
jgi:hypothetical protein